MSNIVEFTEYMNSFYGPEGVYPSTRTLTVAEVADAVIQLANGGFKFEGDSIDRERVRDVVFSKAEMEAMYA